MVVLNAVGSSAPLLQHKSADKRPDAKRSIVEFKLAKLVAVTSALGVGGLAKALTYEEALNQNVTSSSDIDISGILDGIVSFTNENPLIVGGGVLVLAVPLILSRILGKPKNYEVVSARSAYVKLSEDANAQLLDIREGKDIRLAGSPDLRNLKKKVVAITYRGDDKQGFLKKLGLKFKDPANTTLFILDKFDGDSELVAELVTLNGFKAAYAIRDGAEGPRGWLNSGLPWSSPKKGLALDFGNLTDAFAGVFGEEADGLSATLALGIVTALGILTYTEIETVLELLGSAALIQLFTKKFLYAEDRKVTLKQLDEFLNTKVAPQELVDELKMIGKALLPVTSTKASLPAPAKESEAIPASTDPVQSADTVLQAEGNSVPKAEVKEETIPATPRPLSPYPSYPDFKPPSSPSPSAP